MLSHTITTTATQHCCYMHHCTNSLSSKTRHLILIGDHLQLRPKVETYTLRVESGHGYDLNKSMFERLVQASYPHTALQLQHRMPSEVSALVRGMTYPELRDAPATTTRPPVSGLRSRLVFVPHSCAEAAAGSAVAQRQEEGAASKVNEHEASMVVATVKYLLQQGVYVPEQIVVLTPYLAQLKLLRDALNASGTGALVSSADHADLESAGMPVTDSTSTGSDSDSADAAGADTATTTSGNKKARSSSAGNSGKSDNGGSSKDKGCASVTAAVAVSGGSGIRVATVDNFQGGMCYHYI
jgi:superfamily I DNA and/or RNA helicase